MKWGYEYLYVETNETGVVFHDENVKVLGHNSVNRKMVPYEEITSVVFNDSGGIMLRRFTLEIVFQGAKEPYKIDYVPIPGEATRKAQEEGEALKNYIEQRAIDAKKRKYAPMQTTSQKSETDSSVETLLKLKSLLDSGLISIDEFNNMKSRLFGAVEQDVKAEQKESEFTARLTVSDFIIDTGSEKFNFITDYAKGDFAWYEFCETDTTYKAIRGISTAFTYEEVYNIIRDLNPYIDKDYNFLEDELFHWSHIKSDVSETDVLVECERRVVLKLKIDDVYEYSISFYFDDDGKLRLVGYIKMKS